MNACAAHAQESQAWPGGHFQVPAASAHGQAPDRRLAQEPLSGGIGAGRALDRQPRRTIALAPA
ncbi:hypothetical protein AL504_01740 [Achromobacter xylosoxidans]|uniref:Uncharacterized protein n=1 Tax=Alcaligenes xylosoxydans xylosoxydans TaxID=85698 RepID=A0A0X8NV11_ALCXX|nr:hypothetical protein AL504_01740 [Achromobacter xylosoxidans]